jgi:hypothetical protein
MKKIILTDHQQQVFDNLIQDIHNAVSSKGKFIGTLIGPAGTGKTVITSLLVDFFLKKYMFKKLRMATPTHKSLKVVNNYLNNSIKSNKNFSSSTLHSFLKLKMQTVEDKITFVEDLFNNEFKQPIKILLIDECSMVSNDLFSHIQKRIATDNIEVVLFIGDKVQLPPVDNDSSLSKVFTELKQYALTEVVRQAAENTILYKATDIRLCIESSNYSDNDLAFTPSENIIVYNDTREWINSYLNNPVREDSVLTAFTNKSIIQYNSYVRNIINNKIDTQLPMLIDGEYIVLQEAYDAGNNKLIPNGEIVKVEFPILSYDSKLNLDYWSFLYNDSSEDDSVNIDIGKPEPEPIQIRVLDTASIGQFNNVLTALANLATKHKQNKNNAEAKKVWGQYWDLKKRFVDVKYPFAYTCHKLQGSTYTDVYINLKDIIASAKDTEFLYKLVYVALTRAKNKIHILQS